MKEPVTLTRHLDTWLGVWPPPRPGVTVVGSTKREEPGWDGTVRPVIGVSTPTATVLSVPPSRRDDVAAIGDTLDAIAAALPELVGVTGGRFFSGVFRWSVEPVDAVQRGVWVPIHDARVPEWLRPFNGDVLVGFDGDQVAAGVGRKQHDRWGHELGVVTEEGHRGRGWARDLVAQAARRVLADGAIPTYLHGLGNVGSARTADAAGFPDRGWRIHGVSGSDPRRVRVDHPRG